MILRYSDDTTSLAENKEVLEKVLTEMSRTVINYNTKINTSKTNILVSMKSASQKNHEVEDSLYFESKITKDGSVTKK